MDRGQENGKRRLTFHQWVRIWIVAAFVALWAFLAAAETGPEPVDFYCTSLAAARGAGDPDTLELLLEYGYCKHFIADHGFQAYGEMRHIEDIEGTDLSIWFVDFNNTTWVFTVR